MARRVLITGASGFVGHWLARALLERGDTVIGGTLTGTPQPGVLSASALRSVDWVEMDVTQGDSVRDSVMKCRPDWVAHLAGIAFPPEANASPALALQVNVIGTANVLTATQAANPEARVLIVGSADQYGPHPRDAYPIREDASQLPRSYYGSSKAAQEIVALQVWRGSGLGVVCTRSFNHSGVGQAASYLLPALVNRALALRSVGGGRHALLIGNPEPVRDYLHVSDVVEAYVRLLDRGVGGEVYNVCSGTGTSVRQLAEHVLSRLNIDADIAPDPDLMRPSDTPVLVGDNRKLRSATGWTPERSIDDIIDDLIHASAR